MEDSIRYLFFGWNFVLNLKFCVIYMLFSSHTFFFALQSFIAQDPDDRDFLVKNLRSFDVPVLNYVRNENRQKEPFQISEEVLSLRP